MCGNRISELTKIFTKEGIISLRYLWAIKLFAHRYYKRNITHARAK